MGFSTDREAVCRKIGAETSCPAASRYLICFKVIHLGQDYCKQLMVTSTDGLTLRLWVRAQKWRRCAGEWQPWGESDAVGCDAITTRMSKRTASADDAGTSTPLKIPKGPIRAILAAIVLTSLPKYIPSSPNPSPRPLSNGCPPWVPPKPACMPSTSPQNPLRK